MPALQHNIIDEHQQLYELSCIPSCVEMILKLLDRVPVNYYTLQKLWGNKNGGFADFDNKTIEGVTFHNVYDDKKFPRGDKFPLTELFSTIQEEITQGRYVGVSLENQNHRGYHMYVVYDMDSNREFLAVSKNSQKTIYEDSIKKIITRMKGTDILIYRGR